MLLTGDQATTENVKIVLNEILTYKVQENDKILIYFSGHIDPDIRQITDSFITKDYCKEKNNHGVNLRSLRYQVEDSIAKYVLVLIDGCYSGVIAQGNTTITPHWFYFTTGEMDSSISTKLFITAVSSGKLAYQHKSKRNSDFTEIALSVIQEALKDKYELSTGLFFERISKIAEEMNITSPVKSGVEVGRSGLIFVTSKIPMPLEIKEKNYFPSWFHKVLTSQREEGKNINDRCIFIRDNNFPDGSILKIGQTIAKSWRIRNAGKVLWENRFFKMIGESRGVGRIHGKRLIPIPNVHPGQEINVEIELRMPPNPGAVYAEFKMVDAFGDYLFPENRGLYVSFDVIDNT